ncbi:outer membrane protein assembly factor BamB family protein [Rhodopirellula islandica]|nr:PQQ-binding-like beta-propeller repeat protein [Rhodopirellula islandica]
MFRFIFVCLCSLATVSLSSAGDWPEFLGPGGSAHSVEVVPTNWDDANHLAWKVDLPGGGSSSPIVVGDRVIVTCYVAGDDTTKRQVLSFDKNSGEQLWAVDFPVDYREDGYQGYITEHGYASNTPVTDGQNVFVFLGKGGVHCLDLNGQTLWSVDVGKESSNRRWGSAASLVLFENLVIVNAAEESKSIFALDKGTGKEVWRQEAGMLELTYGTPRIVPTEGGESELVISVPGEIWSLNPATGKLKWFAESPMTGNVTPSVIVDGDTVYSFGGYRASGSIAVRAGGDDDVTDSHVRWTNRSSSYVATPLLHEKKLYWIDDRGIAYCTSADDGEVIYRERVNNLESGRPVYASPVLIGDYIYVVTRRSGTLVYRPGDSFRPIAQNIFESDKTDFNASPAVSEQKLYLRSDQSLYCIAEGK